VIEKKIFLGGEGQNELGSRYGEPVYQCDDRPGVLQALLARIKPEGWTVIGACKWCKIRKYRASGKSPKEEHSVLGLALEAKRAGADILAFVRDADDDKERPRHIASAVAKAEMEYPEVAIVGEPAIQVLEAWILAMKGVNGSESLGKVAAQKRLVETGIPSKDTRAMVAVVADTVLDAIPPDAASLHRWIGKAREVLAPTS
jgi:hypothetical protein